jgi:surface antigen
MRRNRTRVPSLVRLPAARSVPFSAAAGREAVWLARRSAPQPAGSWAAPSGASLDEQDRQRAYAAEMEALESGAPGAPVGWRSDHTAYYGTIVPGPYYERRGLRCREYSHTIYVRGRPEIARGTACRNPDGTWTPVS